MGDLAARRGWLSAAAGASVGAAILVCAFAISPNFAWQDAPRESPYAGDFLHEYTGGWLAREGDRSRLYDAGYFRSTQHDPALLGFTWSGDAFFPPLYPPFYYLWVSPLSRLDYRTAAHVWAALGVAALLASVALVSRRGASPAWLGWSLAASLCYVPVIETLVSGQKGTLLLLVFAATYWLLNRQWVFWAGVVFGCAAFKPQLVLAIGLVMLVKREWRFVAGMAATGAVLAAQSLLGIGWEPTLAWIGATLHPLPQPELVGRAHGWLGFARLLTGDYSGPAVIALAALLTTATGIALFRLLPGRLAFGTPRFAIQFSALVLATTLVSPYLYTYDLTLLVLPLLVLADQLRPGAQVPAAQRRLLLASLLLVFLMGGASTAIAARIPLQCSAIASFALLLVLDRLPDTAR